MTTTTVTEQPLDRRATARWLLGTAWFAAPTWAFWQGFELVFTLLGEGPTQAEQTEAARWFVLSALLALGIAAAALVLGGGGGWWAALAVSTLLSALLAPYVADLRPAPEPTPRPYVCQERSGGGTDCPGG